MLPQAKKTRSFSNAQSVLSTAVQRGLLELSLLKRRVTNRHVFRIRRSAAYIDVIRGADVIRIGKRHLIYIYDILESFDYYFSAVQPIRLQDTNLVDYSTPRYHDVIGYEAHPVFFPAFCEPLVTTRQYADFARLEKGSVVLDLGAYSGLTSIFFKSLVGPAGKVVAVDADPQNLEALRKNASLYAKMTGDTIDILHGAAWRHNDGLEFASEGNMGSSAAEILGKSRGNAVFIPSFTLSTVAETFQFGKIDFIKCGIEGAEAAIFEDKRFFQRFSPRIIVEPHIVDTVLTAGKVISDLEKWGYSIHSIEQTGVGIPLLECTPP